MSEKDINFEDKLWKAADKLRKKVEVHEYKYVVLGLIFLRYISFAFEEKQKDLKNEVNDLPREFKDYVMKDRDIYVADGTIYVPEKARWDYIKKNANQPNIGQQFSVRNKLRSFCMIYTLISDKKTLHLKIIRKSVLNI